MELMVKSIHVPYNMKIILWKKDKNEKIIILHKNKKITIMLNKRIKITINKNNNSILLNSNCLNNKKIKYFNNLLKLWNMFFFKKIKFKGKGFRIKFFKKIKIIKFFFGKSHKTFIFLKNINKKKINKYKFYIIGINKQKILKIVEKILKIKKINIYTLRGLRKNRQIIFKRKGKKGTYI